MLMGRSGWMLVMACALLVTGVTLARAGWLQTPKKHPGYHTSKKMVGESDTENPLTTQVGWHWRNAEMRHWRACLLQQH
jgi:hypothetical protein